MSTVEEHTPSTCDQLLDYVYGELAGDALEQFKLHLAGCEKCQRELAGLERVRSAVKQAMPQLEPPADKMAAIHAQLMHAASQQKPKPRGKVLAFARRMVSHPAYAAAAGFVIIAGAITLNWSMGKVMMPAPEPTALHEPVAAPPVAEPAPAVPANTTLDTDKAPAVAQTTPITGGFKSDEASEGKQVERFAKDGYLAREVKLEQPPMDKPAEERPEPKIELRTDAPTRSYAVGHAASKKESGNDSLDGLVSGDLNGSKGAGGALGANTRRDSYDRKVVVAKPVAQAPQQNMEKSLPPPPPAKAAAPSQAADESWRGAAPEGRAAKADSSPSFAQNQVAAAPPNQAPSGPAQSGQTQSGRAVQPSAPAPAAQPPAATSALADDAKPTQQRQRASDPALLKKQAQDYASNGRCDEAVTLYQQLERQHPTYNITPAERLPYVRCLRMTGRIQAAESEMQELKANKQVHNSAVDAEQAQIDRDKKATVMRAQQASPPHAAKKAKAKTSSDQSSDSKALSPSF